ncbi:Methyltransferase family protein [Thalictrum thalictroides]|uniref:Methyltransferase family protein n=1 Tax=Thalictrum thalictroides TaxID=46969 RepID=A0A7J6W709_THATH|nr:Methyltransferase family protein [Thalictrum thalictroides]
MDIALFSPSSLFTHEDDSSSSSGGEEEKEESQQTYMERYHKFPGMDLLIQEFSFHQLNANLLWPGTFAFAEWILKVHHLMGTTVLTIILFLELLLGNIQASMSVWTAWAVGVGTLISSLSLRNQKEPIIGLSEVEVILYGSFSERQGQARKPIRIVKFISTSKKRNSGESNKGIAYRVLRREEEDGSVSTYLEAFLSEARKLEGLKTQEEENHMGILERGEMYGCLCQKNDSEKVRHEGCSRDMCGCVRRRNSMYIIFSKEGDMWEGGSENARSRIVRL